MIGEKIKQRRKELGLTQDELAAKIGGKKNSVSNYELNLNSPPEKVIIKLMEALECDANYLFSDCDTEDITLTEHEIKLVKSYRENTNIQFAVDKLLGISKDDYIQIYRAARSEESHDDEIIKMSKERLQKLREAPETDDDL